MIHDLLVYLLNLLFM